MTKRERIQAALHRQPVDRPPVAFWQHVPHRDHTARGLADAMLEWQRRWDLDLVKIMSSGVYCVEDWGCKVAYQGSPNGAKTCTQHAVRQTADWARIKPLDPGRGALGRELEAALHRAIAELPEDRRAVVILRDLQGLSYEEIAEALDLELNTVRSRLHRARLDLKEKMERFLP